MSVSIAIRSCAGSNEYFMTVDGAYRRAVIDAGNMGCEVPDALWFMDVLESGATFRLIGAGSEVEYRVDPLGD